MLEPSATAPYALDDSGFQVEVVDRVCISICIYMYIYIYIFFSCVYIYIYISINCCLYMIYIYIYMSFIVMFIFHIDPRYQGSIWDVCTTCSYSYIPKLVAVRVLVTDVRV